MNSDINVSFGMKIKDIRQIKGLVKTPSLNSHRMKGYTAFINADVFLPNNKIRKADLLFKDSRLVAVNDFDENKISKKAHIALINLKNKYLTPAVIEQHIHGGFGLNFNTAAKEQIEYFLKKMQKYGCSEILATLIPDKIENINKQLKILSEIIKNPKRGSTQIFGVNLEGPFFSPEKSGIHLPEILIKPSVEDFDKIKSDDIKMVTIAPELDKDYKLTEYLNSKGIIPSAGHTMATAEDIRKSGVKQITHLYNAMPAIQHRNLSATNEALLNDKLYTELNSDLNLVAPEMVDLTLRIKPKDKIILISDALEGTHCEENYFYMNGLKIDIVDGTAKSSDGTLAGSVHFLSDMAKKIVESTKITFEDFIRFSSVNPAENLGIEKRYQLKPDSVPNFVVWDKKTLKPEKTFIA
ncbi:MAG: N-acetylglucosamine-6-phosphate deacetylase [Candidatus Gastranaerophilaceae bacterium]